MLVETIQTLYLQITPACNLRCQQCYMWTLSEPPAALSTEDKARIIQDFATLPSAHAVAFTGGETLLKPDEIYTLCTIAREAGLNTHLSTNGTLLSDSEVNRFVIHGPDLVTVSLDSPNARVHDFIRGVPGTYEHAVRAIGTLINRRREDRPCVATNSILCNLTFPGIPRLIDLGRDLGVDGMRFEPLSPTFVNRAPRDIFFESQTPFHMEEAEQALLAISLARSRGVRVWIDNDRIDVLRTYFASPHKLPQGMCASAQKNIMIDAMGNVQFCFNMTSHSAGPPVGNATEQHLYDILNSPLASEMVDRMAHCQQGCAAQSCHSAVPVKSISLRASARVSPRDAGNRE